MQAYVCSLRFRPLHGTVAVLVDAVEGLDLDVDADELRATLAARDVLDAKITTRLERACL